MVQVVCPECLEGHLRLHVRYRNTPSGDVVEAAYFITCTRKQKCGWWRPLTPRAPPSGGKDAKRVESS